MTAFARRWRVSLALGLCVSVLTAVAPTLAQRRPRAVPAPVAPKTAAAELKCPSAPGIGLKTGRRFCDVLTGRDPAEGIIVALPPHGGEATLTFDLHNRHTYSEEQVRSGRGYTRYTATVGVLTLDNTLIARGVVQSEFRSAADLLDRIGGGAGATGVKAVAPTGTESIAVSIPADVETVSIVGEKLAVMRLDGTENFTAPGRPIALVSALTITYRPPPPKPPPRRRRR